MDVGMVIEFSGMGVQDRNGPGHPLKLFVVLDKRS
uniref:Uncharacterized protein n=1 Tax=Candidatus Kentrum sp. MB TaxID=2138164 RepID=A0A450XXG9_9GAMM|nr:MAG: hypothetical protein BECKMB1821G_GA0114241_12081 [Candidatus Kentron sp. MB]VFK36152.1 MAG: hypothetical protein BECKMB1821I_GA0114274_12123 [Candidatus Kentron sp. MB]